MTACYIMKCQNEIDSEELQSDLDTLVQWEKDWQLSFNPSKCHIMRLTHARSPKHFEYKLGNSVLSETDGHPYLGVHISTSFLGTLIFIKFHPRRTGLSASSCVTSTLVQNMWKNLRTKHLLDLFLNTPQQPGTRIQKILPTRLKRFKKELPDLCPTTSTSRSEGCVTEMIQSLEWTSLADRWKVRRIPILQQARLDHLSLPIGNLLQPVQRQSRHLHGQRLRNSIN